MTENIVLAILQSAIGLAGILLVFSGFLLTKAGQFESTTRAGRIELLAKLALIPLLGMFACAWLSLHALSGGWAALYLQGIFTFLLVVSAIYAIVALLAM
jgi:hypothetical protein